MKWFKRKKKIEDTEPKSENEILCSLTKWQFDEINYLVDIPSEGIHAFYGKSGVNQGVNYMIKYLKDLEERLK